MTIMDDTHRTTKTIVICMGSSCYSRGNCNNLEIVRAWLKARDLEASVALSGTLCEGRCKDGPIIKIGEKIYTDVDASAMVGILEHEFEDKPHG
jgi:NADH:ubiquinone oxidoreductase subunit E